MWRRKSLLRMCNDFLPRVFSPDVSPDSGWITQHSPRDQIEVDRYINSKQAARSSGLGIRVSKLVPPGAD